MASVDRGRFPSLARYLDVHGGRLDRFPHAQCKGVLLRDALENGKPLPDLEGAVPDELLAVIRVPPPVNVWIPEMLTVAFYAVIGDIWFHSAEEAQEWLFQKNLERFRSPLYRLLMAVVSPQMLFRGTATRWATFHRGSELRFEMVPGGANGTLKHPEHLYMTGERLGVDAPFRAVLAAANAKNPTVTATHRSPTELYLEARWG